MNEIDESWLDGALQVAREAASAAAKVIAEQRARGFEVEYKADTTPVTAADRGAERVIRQILHEHYPDHAIYGEEQGREGEGDWLWLVDPLDGTKSFVRGTPFYSTQIALMVRGELVLGVSAAPHYGETLWARRGGGAFRNGERIHVAATDTLTRTSLSSGNVRTLASDPAAWQRYGKLVQTVNRVRGYGDFCHYHLLAAGSLDLVVESDVNILDIAALATIVREAGGVFTDLAGAELDLATRSVLAATPAVYTLARQALQAPAA